MPTRQNEDRRWLLQATKPWGKLTPRKGSQHELWQQAHSAAELETRRGSGSGAREQHGANALPTLNTSLQGFWALETPQVRSAAG